MQNHHRSRLIAVAVASVAALVLAACASTTAHRSTGEYIDDTRIQSDLKIALINSDDVDANQVNLEVDRGRVTLLGTVDSHDERSIAGNIASNTDGVVAVNNELDVRHHDRPRTDDGRTDLGILADVKTRLIDADDVDANEINVEVEDSEVYLLGMVSSRYEARRAHDLAHQVDGVRHVYNELRVR